MTAQSPVTTLGAAFSDPKATAIPWESAVPLLEAAQMYWLSTVRPDGRPHVTPLMGLWIDNAFHFSTGETERKAKNLAQNPHVVVTTGVNRIDEGLDIVLEGTAERLTGTAALQQVADGYDGKYDGWHFTVGDGVLVGESGNEAIVFRVAPDTVFGFDKGDLYSQTRWRF
jgi:hypothetical protein